MMAEERVMNAVRDRTGKRAADAESADGREPAAMRAAQDADDAIADATSSDDVDEIKPAPDLIEQIYDSAGVPVFLADGAVFIGGTVWDVRASAKAGVRCVA